jgi:hypothetical protein
VNPKEDVSQTPSPTECVTYSGVQLNAALDQILVIQESYPPAIAQLCLNKPMQQQDGIRIPRRYENVKDTGYSKMEPIAKSKASQALIEMSST